MRDENGYEAARENACEALAEYRARDPWHLSALLVEPGAGHFAWSDLNADDIALWLSKAAQARIPGTWPIDSQKPSHPLVPDPSKGWLASLDIRKNPPPVAAATHKGDVAHTSWLFDEEIARTTTAYHKGITRREPFSR